MLKLTFNNKPSDEEYEENCSEGLTLYFDKTKLTDMLVNMEGIMKTNIYMASNKWCALTEGMSNDTHIESFRMGIGTSSDFMRKSLVDYLVEAMKVLGFDDKQINSKLPKTDSGKVSISIPDVLEPLLSEGIGVDVLEPYIEAVHMKKSMSTLTDVYDSMNVNEKGIIEVPYQLERRASGRLYSKNPNVQGFGKEYLKAMTVPNDNYVLVWGDFDQIDLRVMYNTVLKGCKKEVVQIDVNGREVREVYDCDEIFNSCEDKYEAIARFVNMESLTPFDEDKFKEDRKKYKKAILAKNYGQTVQAMAKQVGDMEFAKALTKTINNNPRYASLSRRMKTVANNPDLPSVYTYFGNKRQPPKRVGGTRDSRHNQLMSIPVQGTSNDIVMHMVNSTIREFRKAGVGPADFRVYLVRHDEPIFLLNKKYLHLLHIIEKHTTIQIDDWCPITMSLDIGKYYNVSEKDAYVQYFNTMKFEEPVKGEPRPNGFDPLEESANTESFTATIRRVENDTLTISTNSGSMKRKIDREVHGRFFVHEFISDALGDEVMFPTRVKELTVFYKENVLPNSMLDIYINGAVVYFKEVP